MADVAGTILLVDDDDTVRHVLAEDLAQEGFNIIQAGDGEEAVALAIQSRPDLIISDIVMPRMDGWDLCYTLRLMPSTKTIPFVFLTSLDATPDRIMGIKLGADDYLTKPFTPREVVFKVKAILRRVALRQRLLERQEAQTRELEDRFLLSDFIEYLRHTQRTGLVIVDHDGEPGVILIRQGRPVHAATSGHSGEAAVWEMLRTRSTQIRYREGDHPDLEANISLAWEQILPRVLLPHEK